MIEPPIPPPIGNACPRCGTPVPEGRTYCPHCGQALHKPASGVTFLKIFGAICLAGVCLIAAAIGSCAAIMTPFMFSDGSGSGVVALGIAVAALGVAVACIYGIVKIVKR